MPVLLSFFILPLSPFSPLCSSFVGVPPCASLLPLPIGSMLGNCTVLCMYYVLSMTRMSLWTLYFRPLYLYLWWYCNFCMVLLVAAPCPPPLLVVWLGLLSPPAHHYRELCSLVVASLWDLTFSSERGTFFPVSFCSVRLSSMRRGDVSAPPDRLVACWSVCNSGTFRLGLLPFSAGGFIGLHISGYVAWLPHLQAHSWLIRSVHPNYRGKKSWTQ